ncbi:MAG: metallophosphoesterase family protein [Candidatus Deferrimicrobiaceae bacterium]
MRKIRIGGLVLLVFLWAANAFAWSFAVAGDSRDDRDGILPRILAEVDRSDMEFLIHTGDLEHVGGNEAWESFRKRTSRFRKPLRVVIGNHDFHKPGSREEFAKFFGLPGTNYSFTHKDAHFAIVDNAGGSLTPETLAWLDRDLAEHPKGKRGISFLIIAMHAPPRTDGIFPHGTVSKYGEQSATLLEILKRHKADAVLCSHEHMHYVEEWSGVRVVVSGGAGAPLVPFQRYGYYRIDLEKGRVRESFQRVRPVGKTR